MKWEELTSDDLAELAEKGDMVVILPIGSLERHGPHLPVGTDGLTIYQVALKAAEQEPCIVLPPLFYAYVPSMRQFPGAICIEENTLLSLLENICAEVSRNGFKKILIVNGHGGNINLLRLFAASRLTKRTDYSLYVLAEPWAFERKVVEKIKETSEVGHAGEIETSYMLYLYPQLCKIERVERPAKTRPKPLGELPTVTPVDWVVHCPEGYVGDPRKASAEKGRLLIEAMVEGIVKTVRMIKKDKSVAESVKFLGLDRL